MFKIGQKSKSLNPLLDIVGTLRCIVGYTTNALHTTAGYAASTSYPPLGCSLGFASTHILLNHQALTILHHDRRKNAVRLLTHYQHSLDAGNCSADSRLGSTSHYFNPHTNHTNQGWWYCIPSTRVCTRYFHKAISAWRGGHLQRSMFYLGLASHLVQDACVPHHAHRLAGHQHNYYEKWVQQNREQYVVTSGGLYRPACVTPAEWVIFNSRIAYDYLSLVIKKENTAGFHQATTDLLALAQRSTAGFWCYFLEKVGVSP